MMPSSNGVIIMELQENPPFSDLTIAFSTETQKVHKFMLYVYSDWFKAALDSDFKVCSTAMPFWRHDLTESQEGSAAIITLEDDDPHTVRAMLTHCYTRNYTDLQTTFRNDRGLLFDAQLLLLADKYDCAVLAADVEAAFKRESSKTLEELCALNLWAALDVIYGMPPASLTAGLRKVMMSKYFRFLPAVLKHDEFDKLLSKHAELGHDFLASLKRAQLAWHDPIFTCESCATSFLLVVKKTMPLLTVVCPCCRAAGVRSTSPGAAKTKYMVATYK